MRRDVYRDNATELLGDLTMPPYQVTREDLAQVHVPCLIMRGSESHPLFRSVAGILAESIPSARLVELEGSGHVTYFKRPDEFAAAVAGFIVAHSRYPHRAPTVW